MEAVRVQEGNSIDYTPVSAVAAGEVVVVGSIPLPAPRAIAAAALGSLDCEGVFDVLKDSSTFTAGDAVYWDVDGTYVGGTGIGAATSTASGNNLMGFAVNDAATGALKVRVKLTAAMRTTTIAGSVTADDIAASDATLGVAGLQAAQGGVVTVTGGVSTTAGNAGGAVSLTGGTPGITGAGGAVTIAGAAGGATSGTGGAVAIAGGAGTAGNGDGGAVTVLAGNAHGSGTDGTIGIGTSNSSAINVGATSIATTLTGVLNKPAGASTAAAGSTTADAGALPAGTASVYPTTAADGTKGVVLNAADKVTGRLIFIGNGVSNQILKVYPASGGTINGAGADVAFSSVSGKGVIMYCLSSSGNTWLAW
jgi:predicted RecA/RadA family phage recombinase